MRCFLSAQSLPRFFSIGPQRPTVAQPLQDAGQLWQEGIWVLPTDVRPSSRPEAAEEDMGRLQFSTKMDHQASE